ncbi:MAG: UDP-N-acetylglucosamine 1-carboxyvinyltransferase [Oscillospiraceae bacterium]|nr:UDP-N-acetylglucosamine 1-carboxyvinyltransferase [Oscillospiraceae bacterium]
MGTYCIEGGIPLRGELTIHGAKNSVLPILAGCILTKGVCELHNCPQISDVEAALQILQYLGCETEREGHCIRIHTRYAQPRPIPRSMTEKMRGAILFLGPLLARFGEGELAYPGGCALGERPIDLHLMGLRHMGVDCHCDSEGVSCKWGKPRPGIIALPYPSVGATENLLMAAVACEGQTVLCNCAREPEILDLVAFLRSCGAQISVRGSVIRIIGGGKLRGCTHWIIPDRMEAVGYLAVAASTGGEICLRQVCPEHLAAVLQVLGRAGCELACGREHIHLSARGLQAVSPIRTAPYDGFPTDAQAPIMAVLSCAKGVSVMEETVFSDRFLHVPALNAMGARIHAARRYAVIHGVPKLHGASVEATDLRGGAAMVVAALGAEGCSRIGKTEYIERGYERFAENLRSLGGKITME